LPNPIKRLYSRLGQVGLTRAFVVHTALPHWWDDEIASNPAGYAQGLMLLSRHLGLDLASLQDENSPLKLREFGVCKFKKRANVSEDQLALARVMATRTAQLAAAAMPDEPGPLPLDAGEVRQRILGRGAAWVGLKELLDYCWSIGLPVLHLDHFPKNACRPHGFASRLKGRPVIVLCRRSKHSAWLLFILAHELGHLALGHVPEDGALLDEHIDKESTDSEEEQANAFALELLTGVSERRFVATGRWPNARALTDSAREIARRQMIDPGHIVLNYAHSMGPSFYPVGTAALNLLEPHADAVSLVRTVMAEHLDWSLLPEDSSEFLMRVTQDGRSA
jgi:hypothetical protein